MGRYNSGGIEVALQHESKGRRHPGWKEASVHPTKILTLFGNKISNALSFKEMKSEMKTINSC